jgi:hypothetical protein
MSAPPEPNEDDDSIVVRPWVDPQHNEANAADHSQRYVPLGSVSSQLGTAQRTLNGTTHRTGGKYVRRGTLASLQRQWAKYGFVRIHNKYLVSLAHIRKLRPTSTGSRDVYLSFGTEVIARPVSHRRLSEFKQVWTGHIEAQYEKSFIDLDGK